MAERVEIGIAETHCDGTRADGGGRGRTKVGVEVGVFGEAVEPGFSQRDSDVAIFSQEFRRFDGVVEEARERWDLVFGWHAGEEEGDESTDHVWWMHIQGSSDIGEGAFS